MVARTCDRCDIARVIVAVDGSSARKFPGRAFGRSALRAESNAGTTARLTRGDEKSFRG